MTLFFEPGLDMGITRCCYQVQIDSFVVDTFHDYRYGAEEECIFPEGAVYGPPGPIATGLKLTPSNYLKMAVSGWDVKIRLVLIMRDLSKVFYDCTERSIINTSIASGGGSFSFCIDWDDLYQRENAQGSYVLIWVEPTSITDPDYGTVTSAAGTWCEFTMGQINTIATGHQLQGVPFTMKWSESASSRTLSAFSFYGGQVNVPCDEYNYSSVPEQRYIRGQDTIIPYISYFQLSGQCSLLERQKKSLNNIKIGKP